MFGYIISVYLVRLKCLKVLLHLIFLFFFLETIYLTRNLTQKIAFGVQIQHTKYDAACLKIQRYQILSLQILITE